MNNFYENYYNKKVAIITGGSRGIGFECARKLASEGYNIAICSRSKKELNQASIYLKKNYKIQILPTCL